MIRLGAAPKTPAAQDAVDALADCHVRIRDFTALAARLASASGAPAAEVRDAAEKVHRYFSVALPLHAEDEERSVAPRLAGKDPRVDRELGEMVREHAEHGDAVGRVLAACAVLRDRPEALPEVAAALAAAAEDLRLHFVPHLAREEEVVFPALRAHLSPAELRELQAEMRARRGAT
jgi:iron-sulfur cluster repair protein YtfE (RIC family)